VRGGLIDLVAEEIVLQEDVRQSLTRFDLALSPDGRWLRLTESESREPPGLTAALRLDVDQRRIFESASADAVLLQLTQHARYRSAAQKSAVRALLTQPAGSGLIVSMPTGSGKSLLFQLAALHGRRRVDGACVVVITPTVSLALDHIRTLSKLEGLQNSKALTGDMSRSETELAVDAFRRGEVPVLLVSPEKALQADLMKRLSEAATRESSLPGLAARLTHLFVDEAHIIEAWGRSFRPDFQRLPGLVSILRGSNPELRAVLLSATLPPASLALLRASWRFEGDWLEVAARAPRYECDVVVEHYTSSDARDSDLDVAIDRAPRPAIVYTTEIEQAEQLHAHLTTTRGFRRAALFTGSTGSTDRQRIVDAWANDEIDLVVATSAFGMGIDKPDVRTVVHACLPENAARWYQEIGRASRDGGQGLAVCLFTSDGEASDINLARRLAAGGWLTRPLAEQRWLSMVADAQEVKWVGAKCFITLDLDIVREGLPPKSGDYNRGWNRSLITLMQRADILQIVSAPNPDDDGSRFWQIEVLRTEILNKADPSVWDAVFSLRDSEQAAAKIGFENFARLMRNPNRECVTRSVFELIEPNSLAPKCGRCPSCRKQSASPPTRLHCDGLEKAWNDTAPPGHLPTGQLLLSPTNPEVLNGGPELLGRFVACGIEQFIVPTDLAESVASDLASTACSLGLVLAAEEWTSTSTTARLSSAVFLPSDEDDAARLLAMVKKQSELWLETTWIVVGRADRKIADRRLDQTVSAFAPISEGTLTDLLHEIGGRA
jgi:ATP-dependent DNA helicase RecQ